jgi:JmjC domain, hydroxylase
LKGIQYGVNIELNKKVIDVSGGKLKLNILPGLLRVGFGSEKAPGMQKCSSYLGFKFATFGCHVEDLLFDSTLYLYKSATKCWYFIKKKSRANFLEALRKQLPDSLTKCKNFLTHTNVVV